MDIKNTIEKRVDWIKSLLEKTGAKGIVYGNSGGKDCTLVGALCKKATDNVLGVIMPCQSKQNYGSDKDDAILAGEHYKIEQIIVDLTKSKEEILLAVEPFLNNNPISDSALKLSTININPRLRMITLYAIAQSKGYLVAGTGNLDERTLGYFTKWGDGAFDFNPIADLNVSQVYACLRELGCPKSIIDKAPSAGLYIGQTDEDELGLKYSDVDKYLIGEEVDENIKNKIENAKKRSEHKLSLPPTFVD